MQTSPPDPLLLKQNVDLLCENWSLFSKTSISRLEFTSAKPTSRHTRSLKMKSYYANLTFLSTFAKQNGDLLGENWTLFSKAPISQLEFTSD